jgi:hypothetical protein
MRDHAPPEIVLSIPYLVIPQEILKMIYSVDGEYVNSIIIIESTSPHTYPLFLLTHNGHKSTTLSPNLAQFKEGD